MHIRELLDASKLSSYSRYEYLWEDGSRFKRPTKLPAPEYVDALMNWAQGLLDDESVFPNRIGVSGIQPLASAELTLNVIHRS